MILMIVLHIRRHTESSTLFIYREVLFVRPEAPVMKKITLTMYEQNYYQKKSWQKSLSNFFYHSSIALGLQNPIGFSGNDFFVVLEVVCNTGDES